MSKIWGSLGGGGGVLTDQMILIWTKTYNKTHVCIVVHRMAPHNHLIE